jgi:hypothetical protein
VVLVVAVVVAVVNDEMVKAERVRRSVRVREKENGEAATERKEKGDCSSSVPFFLQLVESKGAIELHADIHVA